MAENKKNGKSGTNESYRNNYLVYYHSDKDLPTVIELTIPIMEHLLKRTIKTVLVW